MTKAFSSPKSLPALLVRFRRRYGLTQEAAAEGLGVSVKTLRNWEQGVNRPRGVGLLALQASLRSPPGWLSRAKARRRKRN